MIVQETQEDYVYVFNTVKALTDMKLTQADHKFLAEKLPKYPDFNDPDTHSKFELVTDGLNYVPSVLLELRPFDYHKVSGAMTKAGLLLTEGNQPVGSSLVLFAEDDSLIIVCNQGTYELIHNKIVVYLPGESIPLDDETTTAKALRQIRNALNSIHPRLAREY